MHYINQQQTTILPTKKNMNSIRKTIDTKILTYHILLLFFQMRVSDARPNAKRTRLAVRIASSSGVNAITHSITAVCRCGWNKITVAHSANRNGQFNEWANKAVYLVSVSSFWRLPLFNKQLGSHCFKLITYFNQFIMKLNLLYF